MTVDSLAAWLRGLDGTVTCDSLRPAKEAAFGGFGMLNARLAALLKARRIRRLYSHQSTATGLALAGRDVVVATPTASGKSLCYNLPVLDALLKSPDSRALYIFPTKALAQDQLAELRGFVDALGLKTNVMVCDGDTSAAERRAAPGCGVVITNPDMLSAAILPRHEAWAAFFKNLRYIVVDELHTYRGVFGSHVANLMARLLRVCSYYGSRPVFVCCSATTANPAEHAKALTRRNFAVVSESGAPEPEKRFIIYNPKVLDRETGLRRSSLLDVAKIASKALCGGISTIVFTRSRQNVELLLAAIKKRLAEAGSDPSLVAGYRCGYLPEERRRIERGLRRGELRGVVSTNALELGIDIGSLDLAVLHGYPGSVASTRQQAGRTGRRRGASAAVMVATASPLDQFLAANPQWLLDASPEEARINRTNEYIRVAHVRCAAAELPFREEERFAGDNANVILWYFAQHGLLSAEDTAAGRFFHWRGESRPASELSLRSAESRVYTITDLYSAKTPKLIGTMDARSAPMLIFPGAVYAHNGHRYIVEELDAERLKCTVRPAVVDYFTESRPSLRTEITREIERVGNFGLCEAVLASAPNMYVKLKAATRENVGHGVIDLPEEKFETMICWFAAPKEFLAAKGIEAALRGLAHLIRNTAPLCLMCASDDLRVFVKTRDALVKAPAVFIADNIPGGVGLAEGAFESRQKLLAACRDALENCDCKSGCPSCVGATEEKHLKSSVRELIDALLKAQADGPRFPQES